MSQCVCFKFYYQIYQLDEKYTQTNVRRTDERTAVDEAARRSG